MPITSKIRRQGGAAVVTIPPVLLKLMQAEIGMQVELSVAAGKLIAQPIVSARKRYRLNELLEGSEAMAELNRETAWAREGDPIGRELS
jgi:antitoxin ChpS